MVLLYFLSPLGSMGPVSSPESSGPQGYLDSRSPHGLWVFYLLWVLCFRFIGSCLISGFLSFLCYLRSLGPLGYLGYLCSPCSISHMGPLDSLDSLGCLGHLDSFCSKGHISYFWFTGLF